MKETLKLGLMYNVLFLAKLLTEKELTKNEIIELFEKQNIKLSRTSVENYINILKTNSIKVRTTTKKGKNFYSIDIKSNPHDLSNLQTNIFQDLKKLIISKKDFYLIKNALYMFYKISQDFDDENKKKIANFGYFSNLNWHIVNKLEKHCLNKDVISVEYMLPDGKSKDIILHADKLLFRENSNRLYISAILGDSYQFSILPVDRIFTVKKVLREKKRFNLQVKLLTYVISKEAFKNTGLDNNETILKEENNRITIIRPVTDEFLIVQKLLLCCPDVYYISDENIKNSIKDKLKTLESIYENK